jgi:hypothetical protein
MGERPAGDGDLAPPGGLEGRAEHQNLLGTSEFGREAGEQCANGLPAEAVDEEGSTSIPEDPEHGLPGTDGLQGLDDPGRVAEARQRHRDRPH